MKRNAQSKEPVSHPVRSNKKSVEPKIELGLLGIGKGVFLDLDDNFDEIFCGGIIIDISKKFSHK